MDLVGNRKGDMDDVYIDDITLTDRAIINQFVLPLMERPQLIKRIKAVVKVSHREDGPRTGWCGENSSMSGNVRI